MTRNTEPVPGQTPVGGQATETLGFATPHEAAVAFAARGWHVHPLHGIGDDGHCTCAAGAACPAAGKHPRSPNGCKDASEDLDQLTRWFVDKWPTWEKANVGIATGVVSGLFVVDVDAKSDGPASWAAFTAEHALSVDTIRVDTGGGGFHLYFAYPAQQPVGNRAGFLTGVDIRGDGGYVVAAGSKHRSGLRYRRAAGDDLISADPVLLHHLARTARPASKNKTDGAVGEGSRNATLTSFAGRLRHAGKNFEQIQAALHAENQANCDPPLLDDEVDQIAASVARYEPGVPAEFTQSGYATTVDGIVRAKFTKGDVTGVERMTNFDARIVATVVDDDGGGEPVKSFEVAAAMLRGAVGRGATYKIRVPLSEYKRMEWPAALFHSTANVYATTPQRKEELANGIKELSGPEWPQRSIYHHTGWRRVNGEWVYLHGGFADGDLDVSLPAGLGHFVLGTSDDAAATVAASLRFLDASPLEITAPLYAAIWRSILGGSLFSVFLAGKTGLGKTVLGLLVQQHFGTGFEAPPASWDSTDNALEALAFTIKDAVLLIDDFVPKGTAIDKAKLQAKAERVLRAQGNLTGKARMTRDAALRATKPPRGLILVTAEDLPEGSSLRSRNLILQLSSKITGPLITNCQRDAKRGLYAAATGGFVSWLAPQLDDTLDRFKQRAEQIRDQLWNQKFEGHSRTPTIIGELVAALEIFFDYAVTTGAVDRAGADAQLDRCTAAIHAAGRDQNAFQADGDPVDQFFGGLRTALATHHAYLAPEDAPSRQSTSDGDLIGWHDGDSAWLLKDAAVAAVAQLARTKGGSWTVSDHTLMQRLSEAGKLRGRGKRHLTIRKTFDKTRHAVIWIDYDELRGNANDDDDHQPVSAGAPTPVEAHEEY